MDMTHDDIADVIREVCERELPALLRAAVREGLAPDQAASLQEEERAMRESTSATTSALIAARRIAQATIAKSQIKISEGDVTGWAGWHQRNIAVCDPCGPLSGLSGLVVPCVGWRR